MGPHHAPPLRYTELGTKMVARYTHSLLARTYLCWAAEAQRASRQREQTKHRAMALMSGKAELLLQIFFEVSAARIRHTQAAAAPPPPCATPSIAILAYVAHASQSQRDEPALSFGALIWPPLV